MLFALNARAPLVHMGGHKGSVVYGPLLTHQYKLVVYKGVQQSPSHTHGCALFTCCVFVRQNTIKLFFSSNEIYSEKGRHQCRNYCETWQLTNGNSICL